MAGKQSVFHKGHYYAAKYRSKGSGDVIVCRVQSVRTARKPDDEAYIVSTNLVTDKTSTKAENIFAGRMKRISKSQAKKIISVHKKSGKEAAREAAASAPEFSNGRGKQLDLIPKTLSQAEVKKEVKRLADKFVSDVVELIGRSR